MPRIEIHEVGRYGVVKDIPAHQLPPEAWSDSRNVRFHERKAEKMLGHENVFGTPVVVPYWAMSAGSAIDVFWMYASLTKMYGTDGTTHADITRAAGGDYGTLENYLWQGGVLGGIPVITNGVDVPQQWATVGLGTPLTALSNWPATALCKIIRPFKNFLIALNITKSGTEYPHLAKWSHPAVVGAVPSSWDETDETLDAGEVELSDAQAGIILDGMTLGDTFLIYKENSTWGMQFVGGNSIMRFFPLFELSGILAGGCVTSFQNGRRHFVATGEDVIVTNGQELESVIDKREKHFLRTNLDSTNYRRSFVVANPAQDEVWFCFPETGATWPSIALVWHSRDGVLGFRELPGEIPHIALGPIPGVGSNVTWDLDTEMWDDDTTLWNEQSFIAFQQRLLQSNQAQTRLQKLDSTNQFNAVNMTAYLERTGLAMVGKDREGNWKADFSHRKLVKRIWPKMEGGPVDVLIGYQEEWGDTVTWATAQSFDPASQHYLDFSVNGRLIAVRFESDANVEWELHGYDLEIEILGEH